MGILDEDDHLHDWGGGVEREVGNPVLSSSFMIGE